MFDVFFNDFYSHIGVLSVESEQSSINSLPVQHRTLLPEVSSAREVQIALPSVQFSAMLQPGDAPPPNPPH